MSGSSGNSFLLFSFLNEPAFSFAGKKKKEKKMKEKKKKPVKILRDRFWSSLGFWCLVILVYKNNNFWLSIYYSIPCSQKKSVVFFFYWLIFRNYLNKMNSKTLKTKVSEAIKFQIVSQAHTDEEKSCPTCQNQIIHNSFTSFFNFLKMRVSFFSEIQKFQKKKKIVLYLHYAKLASITSLSRWKKKLIVFFSCCKKG